MLLAMHLISERCDAPISNIESTQDLDCNTPFDVKLCLTAHDSTCCAMLALADLPTLSYASMLLSLANALSLSLHAYMIRVVFKNYAILFTTWVSLSRHSRPS